MILLDVDDLIHIAGRVLAEVQVRDAGLLEAAVARPAARVLGDEAYPTLHEKAAALLHSLVRSRALVDGNERLGLASVIAFDGMNGWRLTLSNDEAHDLVIAVAAGELDDVRAIAKRLAAGSGPRA